VAVAVAWACVGCTGNGSSSETSAASSTVAPSSTTTIAAATTAETATSAVPATDTATTPAATAPPDTTSVPSTAACPNGTTIPPGATDLVAINGDIDGDTLDDVVSTYSLDGIPHVHATLATGGNSDTEVPIGAADTVSAQFMDFDHSLGAEVPPPLAVLAIGASKAGTAVGTFLTLTPQYCIRVWHNNTTDDTLFTFRVSAEPIYQGLQCDGAAGSINHSLTTAEPAPGGGWAVSIQPFGHDFTTVELHDVETFTVPDDPDIQHQFGDLTSCGITLFPCARSARPSPTIGRTIAACECSSPVAVERRDGMRPGISSNKGTVSSTATWCRSVTRESPTCASI
jgi:hypothetical protein